MRRSRDFEVAFKLATGYSIFHNIGVIFLLEKEGYVGVELLQIKITSLAG